MRLERVDRRVDDQLGVDREHVGEAVRRSSGVRPQLECLLEIPSRAVVVPDAFQTNHRALHEKLGRGLRVTFGFRLTP